MADNNYKEGNSLQQERLPVNPYAQGGVIKNLFPQIDNCSYYASFSYVLNPASSTITPLTGNLSADLRYYRVEISDTNTTVTGTLDLANRAAPFSINTSTLDIKEDWIISFFGEVKSSSKSVGCSCQYSLVAKGTHIFESGNSIPSVENWNNVQLLIKLKTTDDADFTDFPVDGVELSRDEAIDFTKYTTTGTLKQNGAYQFTVLAKKVGLNPLIALPVGTAAVINAVTPIVTHPYGLLNDYVAIDEITLETANTGTLTGTLASDLINEGVTPSISVTINTIVA